MNRKILLRKSIEHLKFVVPEILEAVGALAFNYRLNDAGLYGRKPFLKPQQIKARFELPDHTK